MNPANAIRVLLEEGFDEAGVAAEPALMTMLEQTNKTDSLMAIKVFSAMGTNGLPGLMKALTNKTIAVRSVIPGKLAALGGAASDALPFLTEAQGDPDPVLQENARLAIGIITRAMDTK